MHDKIHHLTLSLFYPGCFALYYLIGVAVSLLPNYLMLQSTGLLLPILCLTEFSIFLPLYIFYISRRSDIPCGRLKLKQTMLFMGMMILLMLIGSIFMPSEAWMESQYSRSLYLTLFSLFCCGLLAPVVEEILFRGFILQCFLQWLPSCRFACFLLTSLLFAAIHTQYTHWQTMLLLILMSHLLCYARLKTNSLILPIFLHTINNLIAFLPSLYYIL